MLLDHQGHVLGVPTQEATLDFAALLGAGIRHCQALGGALWTDYNAHDPGVTTLEQLCYALTDLAYRCRFPMPDLLAEQPLPAAADPLLTGDRILPAGPLTAADYSRLLYLQLPANGKTVWMEALPKAGRDAIDGLYTMYVEAYACLPGDVSLRRHCHAIYAANRNVGEDLHQVVLLQPCPIEVSARVDIAPDLVAEEVLADLLYQLQDLLVPFVATSSVERQLAAGVPPEQIYCGPVYGGTLVDGAQWPARRRGLEHAEVASAMRAVPGVLAVAALSIEVDGVLAAPGARILFDDAQVPRLAPSIFEPPVGLPGIVLTRQGQAIDIDGDALDTALRRRLDRLRHGDGAAGSPLAHDYATLPAGQRRDVARYVSIQRHFPQTYGIGEGGVQVGLAQSMLSHQQADERIAQSRQLKAYLLFFEQLLADCGAQLAHAGRLLSFDPSLEQGYFWQSLLDVPEGPPDMLELLRVTSPAGAGDDGSRYSVHLATPPGGEALLRSVEFTSMAAATDAAARMLERGGDPAAYSLRSLPNGEIQLLLGTVPSPLAFFSRRLASTAAAQEEASRLAAYLTRLAQDDAARGQALAIVRYGTASVMLLDADLAPLLEAGGLTPAEQMAWLPKLLRFGVHAGAYDVAHGGDGSFYLTLADAQGIFAQGIPRYRTRELAAGGAVKAADVVRSLCDNRALQAQRLVMQPPPPPPAQDPRIRSYQEGMQGIVMAEPAWLRRRGAMLDHLLARFNERFDDEALRHTAPPGAPDSADAGFERQLIECKLVFLRHLASARGRHDLGGQAPPCVTSKQLADLNLRLRLLLGIPDLHGPEATVLAAQPMLIDHVLLRNDLSGGPDASFYSARLSMLFPAGVPRFQLPAFRALAPGIVMRNCPAHLAVELIWPCQQQMTAIQDLHAAWTHALTAGNGVPAAALALANSLYRMTDAP